MNVFFNLDQRQILEARMRGCNFFFLLRIVMHFSISGFFSSRLILKNFKNIRNTSCVKKFTYFCSFLNLTKISRIIQSSFIFSYKETTSINSLSLSLSGLSDESMEANLRHHELDYFVRDTYSLSPTKSASSERVEKFSATVPLSNLVARQIGMALLAE